MSRKRHSCGVVDLTYRRLTIITFFKKVSSKIFNLIKALFCIRHPHMNVQVLDVKCWIGITDNFLVSFHNFFNVFFDEIIKRVNMLLDQSFGLEEGWH